MMNLELDQDGHLVDYTIWTPEVAQELANSGIHLQPVRSLNF